MARRLSEASREWLRRALEDIVSIDFFSADPSEVELGEEARLCWSVENAEMVTIEPGLGEVSAEGRQLILPFYTTRYTLIARGSSETVRQRVRVRVRPLRLAAPPQILSERPHLMAERPRLVDHPRSASRDSKAFDWLRGFVGR